MNDLLCDIEKDIEGDWKDIQEKIKNKKVENELKKPNRLRHKHIHDEINRHGGRGNELKSKFEYDL